MGSVVVPKARAAGLKVIPHLRPKTAGRHPLGKDPDALVCDLGDAAALDAAMVRADAVACLVGTMRKRFAQGDTYESSDYMPVVQLIESAKRAGGGRHFTLLSSVGARPGSGYLGWKWKCEEAVRKSGLPYAILRPSFFDDTGAASTPSDGGRRRPPPLVAGAIKAMGYIPGLRSVSERILPISINRLAEVVVRCATQKPAALELEGRPLRHDEL